MTATSDRQDERAATHSVRALAEQAFSRAAGTPLQENNYVALLKDASENYPAWLDAIRGAKRYVLFESYIIHEDEAGREFADALLARAREGVRARLIYDWMGGSALWRGYRLTRERRRRRHGEDAGKTGKSDE